MVFKRTYKRPAFKKTYKKKTASKTMMRVPKQVAQNVYTFKRNATATVLVPNTTTQLGTISYTFASLLGNAEFSALFDRYKINKVVTKVWIRNGPDAQNLNNGNNSWYPKFHWYRDTDDTSIPASVDAMRQVGRLRTRVMTPDKPITLVCIPNILATNYATAVSSSYTPKYKQWIDFDYTNTLHLGWKYAIDNIPSTVGNLTPYAFDMEHTYYFQCKDVQ